MAVPRLPPMEIWTSSGKSFRGIQLTDNAGSSSRKTWIVCGTGVPTGPCVGAGATDVIEFFRMDGAIGTHKYTSVNGGTAFTATGVVAATAPGDGLAIPVTDSGTYSFAIGAGAETNTLAAPTFAGQTMDFYCESVGAGSRAVTVATAINQAANTVVTMQTANDFCHLRGVRSAAAGTLVWRLIVNDGCTLA